MWGMKEFHGKLPFKSLGEQLKRIRQKKQESLAEVSGAVEIDVTLLTDIEYGSVRPSEDILMLLMNHFAVPDDEAVVLWEMAGYIQPDKAETLGSSTIKQVMVLPMDARVAYTDMAHIVVNDRGVVMNFMQEAGLGGQPLAVARIGMSRKHAEDILELLQKALAQHAPKMLPAPDQPQKTDPESRDGSSKKLS